MERRSATEVTLRPLNLLTVTLIGTAFISAVHFVLWSMGHATFASGTGVMGLNT
jgi:hypothetical protein